MFNCVNRNFKTGGLGVILVVEPRVVWGDNQSLFARLLARILAASTEWKTRIETQGSLISLSLLHT
jgi:hypothetical protein